MKSFGSVNKHDPTKMNSNTLLGQEILIIEILAYVLMF